MRAKNSGNFPFIELWDRSFAIYFYLIISREQYIEGKLIYQYGGTKIFSLYVCGFDRTVLYVQHTRCTQELSFKIALVINDPCMSNISETQNSILG